jgi:peptide/nickel transport system permease protein
VLGAIALFAVAVVDYGMIRALRPDLGGDQPVVAGTLHDLDRIFLHFDFGRCLKPGCESTAWLWKTTWVADVSLLAGAVVAGVVAGVLGGLVCAAHPRSGPARAIEGLAMIFYSIPPYVLALGSLLLFAPIFGLWPLPWFFDSGSYRPVTESPWDWFRSLLVPWIVLAAPVGASCLRLTLGMVLEDLDADHVRTARAKGLHRRVVLRRHAAPAAYPVLASFLALSVPALVTNVVLVEWAWGIPGFFKITKRAIGKADPPVIDIPTLQALALWAAALIVVTSVLADVALARLDPRVRAGGARP